MNFNTPIVLIIYNRPEQTEKIFSAIKHLKPAQLFIIADGPKDVSDRIPCEKARNIINNIDWKVDLKTNFLDYNVGCALRIVSGLDWVFEQVETAIVLEDDCLPHYSFFDYCDQLLKYYKNDEQVMHISGYNVLQKNICNNSSYFFSNYVIPPWGWATWKRAWENFNHQFNSWQLHKKEIHHHISQINFKKWTDTFEYIRLNKTAWDVPWNIDLWVNKGLGIIPSVNLIQNMGFGEQATFTKNKKSRFSSLLSTEMLFPLKHPHDKVAHYDKEIESVLIEILNELE